MSLRTPILPSATPLLGRRSLTPWILVLAAIALVLRFLPGLTGFVSVDMWACLIMWIDFIREHGLSAYGITFSNYSPLYTYFLGLVSLLPPDWWVWAVKAISIAGDVALACAAGAVVSVAGESLPRTVRVNLSCAAAAAVLWLPSVWINSAVWGLCDVLWCTCCICSLLCFMRGKAVAGLVWYGFAISFKFQAMFFFPVVCMLFFAGKVKWWQLFIIPAVYIACCVPCAIAGRRWTSLLGIYIVQQPGDQDMWYYNAASPYYFVRDWPFDRQLALCLLIPAALFAIWLCFKASRRYRTPDIDSRLRLLLVLTAFSGVFFPYVLPMMHERYMYLGDIATLVCALAMRPSARMWAAALFTQCASVITTHTYLRIFPIDRSQHLLAALLCSTMAVALLSIEMYNLLRKKQC